MIDYSVFYQHLKKFPFLIFVLFSLSSFGFEPTKKLLNDSNYTAKPYDKFSVSFGGFFAAYHNGIKIGSDQLGLGISIDLENALGLDVSTWATRGKVNYRFGKTNRHGLSFGFFSTVRNALKKQSEEIIIGDLVIPIGAEVRTSFTYSIYRLKYNYSIFQDDRVSLGVSFGFFILPVKFKVEVDGKGSSVTNFVAPLPVLGVSTDFLITPKLYFRQSVEVLYLSFDGFVGSLIDLDLSIEYKPLPRFGFGLGFNDHNLNLTAKNGVYPGLDFYGNISSSFSGIYLFAKYSL